MILLVLFSLSAAPLPQGTVARAESVRSQAKGEETLVEITGLHIEAEGFQATADFAFFRLATNRDQSPPTPHVLAGRWMSPLLSKAQPLTGDGSILEVRLKGLVSIQGDEGTLRCSQLLHLPGTGLLEIEGVDLLLRAGVLPGGWPLRLVARSLTENADGSFRVVAGKVTTCDEDSPHFAVRAGNLEGLAGEDGILWKAESVALEVLGAKVLPLPSSFFRSWGKTDLAGFHSVAVSSNARFGTRVEARWRGVDEDALGRQWSWAFAPSASTRRGFPLEAEVGVEGENLSSHWKLFHLRDAEIDVHPYARRIQRSEEERWRARVENRFTFRESWVLDADLALTSDVLVDPEFFPSVWRTQKDQVSQLYLARRGQDHFFEATFEGADSAGFSPFAGFGAYLPGHFESRPRFRWEAFPSTLASAPAGLFGGTDGRAPVNFSWGGELASFQFRETPLDTRFGVDPLLSQGELRRNRGRVWWESSIPLHAGGISLRPGIRMDGASWADDDAAAEERVLAEAYLDISSTLSRSYSEGWGHRVQPLIRFRNRRANRESSPIQRVVDSWDLLAPGQAVEMSVRQYWTAPSQSTPWAELDLRLPWYPDLAAPLSDSNFLPDHGDRAGDFGPGEIRLWLEPERAGTSFSGAWLSARLRRGDSRAGLEESYLSTGFRPFENLRASLAYREVRDLFGIGVATADWRLGGAWGVSCRQAFTTEGDPGVFSEIALQHYAHDFQLEAGVHRDETLGRSGFFFSLTPLFLMGPSDSPGPRMRP